MPSTDGEGGDGPDNNDCAEPEFAGGEAFADGGQDEEECGREAAGSCKGAGDCLLCEVQKRRWRCGVGRRRKRKRSFHWSHEFERERAIAFASLAHEIGLCGHFLSGWIRTGEERRTAGRNWDEAENSSRFVRGDERGICSLLHSAPCGSGANRGCDVRSGAALWVAGAGRSSPIYIYGDVREGSDSFGHNSAGPERDGGTLVCGSA